MDAFAVLGSRADKARAAYNILNLTARYQKPCPSLEYLGAQIGIAESTMGKLLSCMEDADLIRRIPLETGGRVIEIVATGDRTGPTQSCGSAGMESAHAVILANASGWPKRTMSEAQFVAAVAALGRFEDSPVARRDIGSRERLPDRAPVFSPCGISRVYDHGGSNQRNVAGRL